MNATSELLSVEEVVARSGGRAIGGEDDEARNGVWLVTLGALDLLRRQPPVPPAMRRFEAAVIANPTKNAFATICVDKFGRQVNFIGIHAGLIQSLAASFVEYFEHQQRFLDVAAGISADMTPQQVQEKRDLIQ